MISKMPIVYRRMLGTISVWPTSIPCPAPATPRAINASQRPRALQPALRAALSLLLRRAGGLAEYPAGEPGKPAPLLVDGSGAGARSGTGARARWALPLPAGMEAASTCG